MASYQTPSPALAELVDQPRLPGARICPDYSKICFMRRPGLQSIADLAGPELKLGGIRFNPDRWAPSRSGFSYDQIQIHDLTSHKSWEIDGLPCDKILSPSWSPDSRHLVFLAEDEEGLTLWGLSDNETKARKLCPYRLNGVVPGTVYRWATDGKSILAKLVVDSPAPHIRDVPTGPQIQQTSGEKAPVRTYQDLLKSHQDAQLLEHYATSQLARISMEDGTVEHLGSPCLNVYFDSSPDGHYILQRILETPFSFAVPYSRFGGSYQLLSASGELLKTLSSYKAIEELPKGFDSVRTGRREFQWRDDVEATLLFAEALDGGDMKCDVSHHDRLFTWKAPFQDSPEEFIDLESRFHDIEWAHDGLALLSEWRYSDRKVRTWALAPGDPSQKTLFCDRSYNDQYRNPGVALRITGPLGTRVLATIDNGKTLLLAGRGATPEGNIPFLDQWNSTDHSTRRVWSSQAPYYERVMGLMSKDANRILTLREGIDEPPNFWLRDLKSGEERALTALPHPTPDYRNLKKELITYQREDGVQLSGTLYLPPDYDGGRVPVVMWAYPQEFVDADVAGQVTNSPYEFNRVSYWGPLPFLALGWAVLDDPKMPIVGKGEALPNDNFCDQLVSSAKAAVDTLVERGICDPERVAIGGHSYGAFMVANLLAHCELFQTGIARSGAYNRTLTPFGFQGEERDFWEGQTVYCDMSPFFHADKIKKPILLIHGAEDNNAGTYPMQSERFFSAIKGLGGNARLVMLPKESHAYRARESLLHMLWEEEEWLKAHFSTQKAQDLAPQLT